MEVAAVAGSLPSSTSDDLPSTLLRQVITIMMVMIFTIVVMIMIKGLPFSTSVDLSSTFFIQHFLGTYHVHKIHQNHKVFPLQPLMKILSLSMASSSHDTAGCADDHDNDMMLMFIPSSTSI